jgi:hypothetical protein
MFIYATRFISSQSVSRDFLRKLTAQFAERKSPRNIDSDAGCAFLISRHSEKQFDSVMKTNQSDGLTMNPGESQDIASKESRLESSASGRASAVDPERWVEQHSDILFGFAAARVRNHAIAQDLVQETFLAAIKASSGFAGRATASIECLPRLVSRSRFQCDEVSESARGD